MAFPAENPDSEVGDGAAFLLELLLTGEAAEVLADLGPLVGLVGSDISILILFLLFYVFVPVELVEDELIPELLLTMEVSGAIGNVIGNLPKKIINRTSPKNSICPPIIKIKSDVEVSMTHFSMSTIYVM
jgi:hypothetical protein